jgi:hypothetical protein
MNELGLDPANKQDEGASGDDENQHQPDVTDSAPSDDQKTKNPGEPLSTTTPSHESPNEEIHWNQILGLQNQSTIERHFGRYASPDEITQALSFYVLFNNASNSDMRSEEIKRLLKEALEKPSPESEGGPGAFNFDSLATSTLRMINIVEAVKSGATDFSVEATLMPAQENKLGALLRRAAEKFPPLQTLMLSFQTLQEHLQKFLSEKESFFLDGIIQRRAEIKQEIDGLQKQLEAAQGGSGEMVDAFQSYAVGTVGGGSEIKQKLREKINKLQKEDNILLTLQALLTKTSDE